MGKSLIITTGGGTDVEEGSPNATEEQVLSGYTFFAWQDEPRTGLMTNQTGLKDQTLDPSGSYTIPKGFHPGTQKISAVALSTKTSATATNGAVLDTKTGWSGGSKITGTIANKGAAASTLSANGTYTVPAGWHNGSGKVTQSIGTQAATNVTPGTSRKTVVAASKWTTGAQIVLGNSNLAAGNIKKDVTIFGVKGTWAIDPSLIFSGGSIVGGVSAVNTCGMTIGDTSSTDSSRSLWMQKYWNQYCRYLPVIESGALRLFCWHADGTDARWCLGTLGGGWVADGGLDRYDRPTYTSERDFTFVTRAGLSLSSTSKIKVQIDYAKWAVNMPEDTNQMGRTYGFFPYIILQFESDNNYHGVLCSGSLPRKWAYDGAAIGSSNVQRINVAFSLSANLNISASSLTKYQAASDKRLCVKLYHCILHTYKYTGKTPASGVFDSWFWVKNIKITAV